ncbi:acyl-CoA thioesterase [Pseudomonas oryzae]|uniref:Acyl-CoA thioesterase FadM n=1 Tax=Pseudomonas oryzae TaxID=1392877 RepID=A0A1H1YRT9_9PSED|nr:thioesterase family protein [Pseudomonas oryzae]SDT23999.1 Acyl-CoA thioesterase FadM [Pseudomonas oryzae]
MARLQLDLPEDGFRFSTRMTVRSTDINAGQHLGNDALVSMLSEARSRFLFAEGIDDAGDEDGLGIVVTDLATLYKAEAFARDELLFEVGVMDFNKYGGDITFRVSRPDDGALIALAKNGFVFFDYRASRVTPMPESFRARFPGVTQAC